MNQTINTLFNEANMLLHPQQAPTITLTVDILDMVVDAVASPKALLNLACTCSGINSIINRKPLRLYAADVRFQRRRISDPIFGAEHPPTLPGLIYAIRHENLNNFKAILAMYQEGLSGNFLDTWPTDEARKLLTPTPIEAAITAHRFNYFQILIRAGWALDLGGKLQAALDQFAHIQFQDPPNHWMQIFLGRALRTGDFFSISALAVETIDHRKFKGDILLYQVLGNIL
ncbi:hypothetical protein NUW58_g2691 [Xylaria curta]|uniref:Uncharacterized protein n=1 Tax=Xylaria curta TaxID=42375 RepID=A0ACC1PEE2_9PEZI|nr:hypothetical protein NUW58_g2691 [Xylaria curta]